MKLYAVESERDYLLDVAFEVLREGVSGSEAVERALHSAFLGDEGVYVSSLLRRGSCRAYEVLVNAYFSAAFEKLLGGAAASHGDIVEPADVHGGIFCYFSGENVSVRVDYLIILVLFVIH